MNRSALVLVSAPGYSSQTRSAQTSRGGNRDISGILQGYFALPMWRLPPFVSGTSCLGRVWEHLGVELYLRRTTVLLLARQTNFTQGYNILLALGNLPRRSMVPLWIGIDTDIYISFCGCATSRHPSNSPSYLFQQYSFFLTIPFIFHGEEK